MWELAHVGHFVGISMGGHPIVAGRPALDRLGICSTPLAFSPYFAPQGLSSTPSTANLFIAKCGHPVSVMGFLPDKATGAVLKLPAVSPLQWRPPFCRPLFIFFGYFWNTFWPFQPTLTMLLKKSFYFPATFCKFLPSCCLSASCNYYRFRPILTTARIFLASPQ